MERQRKMVEVSLHKKMKPEIRQKWLEDREKIGWGSTKKKIAAVAPAPTPKLDFSDRIGTPSYDPLRIHKELLSKFWRNFGGKNHIGCSSKEIRMQWLKRYAEIRLFYAKKSRIKRLRYKLNKINLTRNYRSRHPFCWCCGSAADVRHHIIQLQKGGMNTRLNLVSLCNPCHREIHPWLKKQGGGVF